MCNMSLGVIFHLVVHTLCLESGLWCCYASACVCLGLCIGFMCVVVCCAECCVCGRLPGWARLGGLCFCDICL